MKEFPELFIANINIRLRSDQYKKIKESGMNVSQFIREKLDEEFETQETLEQEEKELLNKIEKIKLKKEIIKNKKPKEKESNTEKEKFFREARVKIKENPNFLMGQWERYKNLFEKISLEKFKEMIK